MRLRGFPAGGFCLVSRAAPFSFGSRATERLGPPWCPLTRGSVCTEHGETQRRAGAISSCTQCLPPSHVGTPRNQGWGAGLTLLPGCVTSSTVYFRKGLSSAPLPPFIKRSQIHAVAITICPQGAAPAPSFLAALVGGRFTPRSRNCPLQ